LNRKFDPMQGLICSVTGKIADFESSCSNFKADESVKEDVPEEVPGETNEEILIKLDDNFREILKIHQNFSYAVAGGIFAAIISAFLWAAVTVATKFQIGYMAIGVGFIVGYSIQFFGLGVDKKFGYLGAVLSVFGCLLGNILTLIGLAAEEGNLSIIEVVSFVNFQILIEALVETFSPVEIFFYGIAVAEGYKFAFRKVTVREQIAFKSSKYDGTPAFNFLRSPLYVVSIIGSAIFFISFFLTLNSESYFSQEPEVISGDNPIYNGQGNKESPYRSEGKTFRGKEEGKWTYYYENDSVQSTGYYKEGIQDSTWMWFDEAGTLLAIGNFKDGLEEGVWFSYYNNKTPMDSGSYINGRKNGIWKSWYENGNISEIGNYIENHYDSIWNFYYDNGKLSATGKMKDDLKTDKWIYYYRNGKISAILMHKDSDEPIILDYWDQKGNHLVTDRNGSYKSYSENGKLVITGNVSGGVRTGVWMYYHDNGKKMAEHEYKNGLLFIKNSWGRDGTEEVIDGTGIYNSYNFTDTLVTENGEIKEGVRDGLWTIYYPTGVILQEQRYIKGEMTGQQTTSYPSGLLFCYGNVVKGKREGQWIWYNENGNISSTAYFKNDKKEGVQIICSSNGDKVMKEIYKNGILIKKIRLLEYSN